MLAWKSRKLVGWKNRRRAKGANNNTTISENTWALAKMGSRQELIGWVNDLLLLSYNKVEQCGTGE